MMTVKPKTAALALAFALSTASSFANQGLGTDFSAQTAPVQGSGPSARFITDSRKATWPDAVVNYYYNPSNQPAGISTDTVLGLIQAAGRKWENVCKVRFNYLGTQSADPDVEASFGTIDRLSVIGWMPLTGDKAGFDGYVSWWFQGNPPSLVDADMVLNTSAGERLASDPKALGALITHEMGHMLAIRHSDVQQSVMFASPYNSYSFQNTLRGDDAAACASLYGPSTFADANRIFNWAEQSFSQFVAPTGVNSLDLSGYHYRFFSQTNSYMAVKDNTLLFLPTGGAVTPLGNVDQILPAAAAAGF
ncbi:MAG: matrixin family metalloprotease [Burkholderiales bacterium]|nr:matrixin family metalloprotease [Burkholderiales bacterium]